ncbi:MAG: hypothetical protein CR982_00500 [Candidatus Cloacimonadota bacterium]|nr:MAG: hypothetical protein CR982_00500 [Candidatus Cloacimonadota bacterium]PIE78865.1 MAG: hypothetical protein CSA15_05600 [Candidatus Delongbacteria bacterium]
MVPTPDAIPVNWLWFQSLLILTFTIHMLLMNALLGTSLISSYNFLKKRKDNQVAKTIPTLIALTVNFGVPPLLFVQALYGQYYYSSSIVMGIPWFLIIPFIIVGYYGAYIYVLKRKISPVFSGVSIVVSSIILLYIGFMMTNNFTLMVNPDTWKVYFETPSGNFLNLDDPSLFPRYIHFVVSAVAVGGLWRAVYARLKKGDESVIKNGLKIFSYATMVQIVIGLWFFFSLPRDIYMEFMGGNLIATIIFSLGFVLALVSIFVSIRGYYKTTIITALVTIITMIAQREYLQFFYLKGYSPSSLEVTNEHGSLVMFLVTFLVGVYLIYYMISLMLKSKREA